MEEIKSLLDENETILWHGKSDPDAIKENYLFWKDVAIVLFFPFIILNILIFMFLPGLMYVTFRLNELVELMLVYFLTFYLLFIIDYLFASRLRSLYLNRKFGIISYYITTNRIFISTQDMQEKSKGFEYVKDMCCLLPHFDFEHKGSFAFIDQERVNKIEIHFRKNCYHVYLSYNIEEDDSWRFKMGGLLEISTLPEVIVKKLGFEFLKDPDLPFELYIRE